MPPFIPKKRLTSTPPPTATPVPAKKARLADVLDRESRNIPSLQKTKTFSLGSDESDSSLSDVDSDQFEDVTPVVKQINTNLQHKEESEDDEDIEWEDAGGQAPEPSAAPEPLAGGDLELTFRKPGDDEIDYGTAATANAGKKGPTKREKEARVRTHQMHVMFLLWHNAVRNKWMCDKQVQQTLVQQLPAQIKREVENWRRASGLSIPDDERKSKSKKKAKHKSKQKRGDRHWGNPHQVLEPGKANLSRGDPLLTLLKILSAYWKKRFYITAPGLRKRGYTTKQGLKQDIISFRNDDHNPVRHGERIRNIGEFRDMAEKCEGSRDLGAQLFTALLRGVGIETRMVASLQPSGYGWTKAEQMVPRKETQVSMVENSSDYSDSAEDSPPRPTPKSRSNPIKKPSKTAAPKRQPKRSAKGGKDTPIDLDSDVKVEEADEEDIDLDDDASLVDVTPSMPKQKAAKYDREVPFPIYWSEAISPITNQVIPLSPLVLTSPVATTPEILTTFEPRGAKADKAKVVMAYVIGYSPDGSAKDVTVRYLKKHIWPGKTKGVRFPVEKVPVYDKRGKVKRYQDYDWFRETMAGYIRTEKMRTEVDDLEESTDLVPQEPEKKENKDEGDTLQSLKASADFVLERFLRREEALRPNAEPVRSFVSGKGDNIKEEPVYRRSDVERCLTAESWHKEGRKPLEGQTPMKLVPVRAVTLTRKREAEEHERRTGEKQMQGLYSWDQCEYIIPPPIRDGIIPKNAYGNMDCFVPSMVPRGAVHIPLKGTVRICKKLDIDFAEAVTGFEFGNKRAVPVCTGVVVAQENAQAVKDAWREWNEEQRKKEETKMERLVLDLWRKFVMGLRIRERIEDTYGEDLDTEPLSNMKRGNTRDEPINVDADESPPGTNTIDDDDIGGGFLLPHEDDIPEQEDLVMENHEVEPQSRSLKQDKGKSRAIMQYPTPESLSSKPPVQRRRRSRLIQPESEEEEDVDDPTSSDPSTPPSDEEELEDDLADDSLFENPSSTQKRKIEINIPSRKRNVSEDENEDEDDNNEDASSDENEISSPDSDSSEDEEYAPATTKTSKRTPKKSSTNTPRRSSIRSRTTPRSVTRISSGRAGKNRKVEDSEDSDEDEDEEGGTRSPYFAKSKTNGKKSKAASRGKFKD